MTVSTDRQQFLAEWRSGVGASDAGIIAGFSQWKSPVELWLEKRGDIEQDDISEKPQIVWGNKLEAVVGEAFAEVTGLAVRRRPECLRHPDYPWMLCHLDFETAVIAAPVECKAIRYADGQEWGPTGTDEVPPTYLLQCNHQMAVTGASVAYLAVIIAGSDFRWYCIPRDEELIAMLIEQEQTFQQCVVSGERPDLDLNAPGALSIVKKLYPGTNGQSTVLPEEAWNYHQVLTASKAMIKNHTAAADGAKAHLLSLMGESAIGYLPDGTVYTRKQICKGAYEVGPSIYIDFRHGKAPKG